MRSKFTEATEAAQLEALELLREKMRAVAAQDGGKGAQILIDYVVACHDMHTSSLTNDAEVERLNAREVGQDEGSTRRDSGASEKHGH